MKPRWLIFAPVCLLAFFTSVMPAHATNPIVTEPTDFWFEYEEPTTLIAQTYMITGFNSDPMLWLYNEAGTLLASNDDSYGLQSYISRELPAGKYRIRAGICCGNPNAWHTNGGWNLQYELSFNGQASMQTTTTEAPTTTSTTSSTTTSTVPETTTSTSTTTSTTSTSTTTTTSTSTTSTTLPSTTTTRPTSTTSSTTTTEVPTTTTSTAVPVVTTTTTTPALTTTTSSQPSPTTTANTIAPTSTAQATTSTSTSTVPSTTSTTTSLPEVITPMQASPLISELLSNINDLPQSEIASVVAKSAEAGLTKEDAVALATSAEVLNAVTGETATAIFEALDVATLNDDQAEQLVVAVQSASEEVRAAFEETIDLFNGKTDTYVPIGSAVPVRTRRAVIAVTGLLAIAAVPSPISGQPKRK